MTRDDNYLNNRVQIVGRGFIPLFTIDNGKKIICFNKGTFFSIDALSNSREEICKFDIGKKRRYAGLVPLLVRRFGINEIKCIKIDDKRALFNYHKNFFYLDILNREIIPINKGSANGSVLNFTNTSIGILFGDYGYNPDRNEVGIYRIDISNKTVQKIYTFPKGKINHIHNIIEDSRNQRIWILAGDFGKSSCIMYTDDFFKTVNERVSGSQQHRSCNAFPTEKGLIYITDTPFEENHIVELSDSSLNNIVVTNGSCIYSTKFEQYVLYSTTVENQTDEYENNKNAFKYNLGEGIKDWFVELNLFNINNYKQKTILRVKKDILPMLPFQYGCFRFASVNDGDYIYFYGQAVKKYDQVVLRIRKDEII